MKKWMLLLTGLIISLSSISTSDAVISRMTGAQVEGVVPIFPASVVRTCTSPSTCPRRVGTDKVVSTRLWGSNGSQCIVNTTSGTGAWSLCTAQPPDTGELAVTGAPDGSVIAARNAGGGSTNCRIYRSTDAGVSWITVFTAPASTICVSDAGGGASFAGTWVRCVGTQCVVPGVRTGVRVDSYVSSDSGATWSTQLSSASTISRHSNIFWNGAQGIFVPSSISTVASSTAAVTAVGNTWTLQAAFPAMPRVGFCGQGLIFSGTASFICSSTGTSDILVIDGVGNVLKTIPNTALSGYTPPTQSPAFLAYTPSIWYLSNGIVTTSLARVWVSLDAGTSWNILFTDSIANSEMSSIEQIQDGSLLVTSTTAGALWKISL